MGRRDKEKRGAMSGKDATDHSDQEEGRPRRPPRRRVEGGLRGFCDGDDVAVYRAVADGFEREGEEGGGWVFQRSEGNGQPAGDDDGRHRRDLTRDQNDKMQKLKDKLEAGDQGEEGTGKAVKADRDHDYAGGAADRVDRGQERDVLPERERAAERQRAGVACVAGGELKTLPNSLLIEGHTDATQYSTDTNYSNWECRRIGRTRRGG